MRAEDTQPTTESGTAPLLNPKGGFGKMAPFSIPIQRGRSTTFKAINLPSGD